MSSFLPLPQPTSARCRLFRMATQAVGYSPLQRRILVVVPLLLVTATLLLSLSAHYSSRLDTCFIYREKERPPPTYIPLADSALHNYSVFAIWGAMLALLALPAARIQALYSLLYTAVWFHVTYILLCALKAPLDDFNCAGRHETYPNGVSGHYCYFLFVSLSAPMLAQARLAQNKLRPPVILVPAMLFAFFYAVGAPTTLYRTYAHGYHSPRQIMLGSALGLASHAALERFFLRYIGAGLDRSPYGVHAQLAVLAASSLTSFTIYYALWPLSTAGPALTDGHLYFHAGMWSALVIASMLPASSRGSPEKVAA